MYEVEVKVPGEYETVRAALADVDAAEHTTVAQADTYYDAPHRAFEQTDEAFRLRRVATAARGFERGDDLTADIDAVLSGPARADGESRVTYKGPLVEAESKTREEFETAVGDDAQMAAIIEQLGFESAAVVRKLRTKHHFEGFTVLLDAVEDVGEYVEIETTVEAEHAVSGAREDAYAVLRRLGLDPTDQIRTSYLGLRTSNA
ncbi:MULTISPECIES: class IV adenylate cyclase [Halobacterium]|uniref:Adenylate cyclase domain protein n=4 Tax=Halobacterium salinarum TaxID=2242 RepID=Q9HQ74_HALSA|nr:MULTISPECIES: class IV adenylate cyclase [Halobacterium]AAG19643.1 conserved hypothetical protein [Halobacterium salinarum NRC-1]MBB6090333.1 adenylate cyclase class 2 [Halobacterium salinarum]MCF2165151.1 class IV adenylate cyclase [Halobacterium salinarum]MCF2168040.1 class IV adenylate cyclase [Halobacterium salinarum]MCF2206156.1 class IV adenylate cyclase [Halobacterium salinarum]